MIPAPGQAAGSRLARPARVGCTMPGRDRAHQIGPRSRFAWQLCCRHVCSNVIVPQHQRGVLFSSALLHLGSIPRWSVGC